MKRRPSPILAVFAALLLFCAQQGAYAHLIGHLGVSNQVTVQLDEQGHNAALALADSCTTCIALSALGGLPPAPVPAPPLAQAQEAEPSFDAAPLPAPPRPHQRARAPPLLP